MCEIVYTIRGAKRRDDFRMDVGRAQGAGDKRVDALENGREEVHAGYYLCYCQFESAGTQIR